MPTPVQIQALVAAAMAKGASVIGEPYKISRPTALSDVSKAPVVGSALASFSQNYNYNRVPKYDDVLWNTVIDPRLVKVGDILRGAHLYFIASLNMLLPVASVRCTCTVNFARQNLQIDADGGEAPANPSQLTDTGGRYWGISRTPQPTTTGVGEHTFASNVPALAIANAGRATGTTDLADDAPGPARWRFWTPASVLPKGSIKDRDVIIDDLGNRHYVSAAQWTEMGYRCEAIRLEM